MCFKKWFKKKEKADDLFLVRATRSIDTIKEMKKLLGNEERGTISTIAFRIDGEKDKFTSLSSSEVNKIFDNLDKIVVEIKRCATEKATFTNNQFRTHSLTESVKTYIKVLEHYVNNNVIAGSFRMADGDLEEILKAVELTSACEEYEHSAENFRANINALGSQIEEKEKKVSELKNKVVNDSTISDGQAKRLLDDVKQVERKIKLDNDKLKSYRKSLKQIEDVIDRIERYRIMLERYFAGQSIRGDSIVAEMNANEATIVEDIIVNDTTIDIMNRQSEAAFNSTLDSDDDEVDDEYSDLLKQRKANMENKENIERDNHNFGVKSDKQEVNNKY